MKIFITFFIAIYSCTIQAQCGACQYPVELVTNGNFSSGNTGFTSNLEYVTGIFTCPLCPENTYTIGANAILYHSDFWGQDHTNPPNGNFFIANGEVLVGSTAWCQNLVVQPNTDYTFSFWAQDIKNDPLGHPTAELQASFNGEIAVDTLFANGPWEQLVVLWNSGTNITLELCIVNQQWLAGGNDYGLDDISFSGCNTYQIAQTIDAGADQIICSNEATTLGQIGAAGCNYSWNNATGLSSISISNPDLLIENYSNDTITQEYILTMDSANVGCIQTDTVLVTVLPAPPFSLGNDSTICPQQTIEIDAGNVWDNVVWSNAQTTNSITTSSGTYWANVQYNNCFYTDTIVLSLLDIPQDFFAENETICSNQPLTLDAGYVGLWSNNEMSQTILIDETGIYTFTYTEGPCTAIDQITVTVFEFPILTLPADTVFCENSSVTLNANAIGIWNTGISASSIIVDEEGSYDIAVTNGPCYAEAATNVAMILLPEVNLQESILLCDGNTQILNVDADQNATYLWSTGDTTEQITVTLQDNYSVIIGNECGTIEDEVYVETYLCDWQIFIPLAFTPNDDDKNETWRIEAYNITNLKISIYNRLGAMIFFTNDINEGWAPGIGIGDDVYNYRIEALTFENEYITKLGHIYLLR